ncbi:MAG: hypothetical protein JNL72_01900 [Flavipsychrobacter sp.]|nr:hypothetical protein [Flavipsychrobacter sp.]
MCFAPRAWAQPGNCIRLDKSKPSFTATNYLVTSVTDERSDTSTIGYLRNGQKKVPLTLCNGAASSLYQYLSTATQVKEQTPVQVAIAQLQIGERKVQGRTIATSLIKCVFVVDGVRYLQLTSEGETLTGERNIEQSIRRQMDKIMVEFGKWFDENKEHVLAEPSISVTISVDNKPDNGLVAYSRKRPLTYNDFQGRASRHSDFAAATSSGISLATSSVTEKKHTELKIKVGAFFHKNESWFRDDARHDYVLEHEQLHFDITALIACELIEALGKFDFDPDTYDKKMGELHGYFEEMKNQLQAEYDEATNHGLDTAQQEEWKNKIRAQLAEHPYFK